MWALEAAATLKGIAVEELIREGARLWFIDGAIRRGPYCSQCYDAHRTLVRLDGADFTRCRLCNVFSGSFANPSSRSSWLQS
jgi:hypothetical protein